MDELIKAIGSIRDSVGAVMRIHPLRQSEQKKERPAPPQFKIGIVGTAWCIAQKRYFVTANHIFNAGQPRDLSDRFFIFVVPQNAALAYHMPVTGFHLEDPSVDMAIMEIDASSVPNIQIPPVPVSFDPQLDGERVLTYGFPAPQIVQPNVDHNGNWVGGQLFLKSHANEGIISAQYEFRGALMYELNVDWHHGESGGPICQLDPVAAFAVMQDYRNVRTPHGTVAGPHRGRSLAQIESTIRNLGATVI